MTKQELEKELDFMKRVSWLVSADFFAYERDPNRKKETLAKKDALYNETLDRILSLKKQLKELNTAK